MKPALRGSNGSGLDGLVGLDCFISESVWVRGVDVRSTLKDSSLDSIGGVAKHSEGGEERAERNVGEATEAEGVDSSEAGWIKLLEADGVDCSEVEVERSELELDFSEAKWTLLSESDCSEKTGLGTNAGVTSILKIKISKFLTNNF